MRMFKKEEGFTLVELMVVVLIIGILVAIAIPVFNAASDSARERTCFANQRTIEGSVQQWAASDSLATPRKVTASAPDVATLVADGYLKSAPTCPTTAAAYTIANGIVADCATHGHY